MKFRLKEAEKLWLAASTVYKLTPRRNFTHANEIALQLTGSTLSFYRDSNASFCQSEVEVEQSQEGKVILADARYLQFVHGEHEAELLPDVLRLTNVTTGEKTELPVSLTLAETYQLPETEPLEFRPIPVGFERTTWASDKHSLEPLLHFTAKAIGCHERSILASFLWAELPLEQDAAIPVNLLPDKATELCFSADKVWFRNDDMLCYITTQAVQSTLPILTNYYTRTCVEVTPLVTLRFNRSELLSTLTAMNTLAYEWDVKEAFARLSYDESTSRLSLKDAGGRNVRYLTPLQAEGTLAESRIRVAQFMQATAACEKDEVVLSKLTPQMWVLTDGMMYNLIAALSA